MYDICCRRDGDEMRLFNKKKTQVGEFWTSQQNLWHSNAISPFINFLKAIKNIDSMITELTFTKECC